MDSRDNASTPPELITALKAAAHVLVFTGAGVSAESGIPTFRDALTGLWSRFDAEALATPEAFLRDPELVWGWYEWRRMQVLRSLPNPAHIAIAELARQVLRLTVVTQNVDDLHERAGSVGVLHLHGSLHHPRCFDCGRSHPPPPGEPPEPEGGRRLHPPLCTGCGGLVRPGIVWFGESLPEDVLAAAFAAARACDLLIAIGTSGLVQPAARIPWLARQAGATVVQVNPMATALDDDCTWSLRGAAGLIMPRLLNDLAQRK
jgi:NAD-dependent deacetylase